MNESPQPFIYKFSVTALTSQERSSQFVALVKAMPNIEQVDVNLEKRLVRIVSTVALDINQLKSRLGQDKYHLEQIETKNEITPTPLANQPLSQETMSVGISGMTCRSCELTVERKWKKIPGVKKVVVNCATGKADLVIEGQRPSMNTLQSALGNDKYHVYHGSKKHQPPAHKEKRPSFFRLLGLFALVFLVGQIFSNLGLFKTNFTLGSSVNFGTVFIIGLVAASSSCIAVVGGLLLSSAAKFNERYSAAGPVAKMRPVMLFIVGRIVSYTVLGGLLGVVGSILAPSPTVTAIIAIAAACYMIIMGLDMLHIAPDWLKAVMPRMPKSLSHRIMDAEGKEHPLAPFGLGAATFFLPCGFTQALQLYALTTHSFAAGATTLLAFALGTAPALLALGWASSSLKGKAGKFFFQFAGALVIVLGFLNIQSGLTILGYPISLPSFGGSTAEAANTGNSASNVVLDGDTQVVKMVVNGGYEPNHFTIRAGKPVRWEVDGTNASGCISVLVSRQLGVQKFLQPGINTIEFTPQQAGEVAFSCSMGMYRGSFTVLPPA